MPTELQAAVVNVRLKQYRARKAVDELQDAVEEEEGVIGQEEAKRLVFVVTDRIEDLKEAIADAQNRLDRRRAAIKTRPATP